MHLSLEPAPPLPFNPPALLSLPFQPPALPSRISPTTPPIPLINPLATNPHTTTSSPLGKRALPPHRNLQPGTASAEHASVAAKACQSVTTTTTSTPAQPASSTVPSPASPTTPSLPFPLPRLHPQRGVHGTIAAISEYWTRLSTSTRTPTQRIPWRRNIRPSRCMRTRRR